MGNGNSNGAAGDTLELLEAEREDFQKTLASVRQMARDFDTLAERRKRRDVTQIALHLQLKGPDLRRCVWKGFTTPEAFQWFKPAIARKKALGEQMLRDVAAYREALVRWAEGLEKREQDYRAKAAQQPASDPARGESSGGKQAGAIGAAIFGRGSQRRPAGGYGL